MKFESKRTHDDVIKWKHFPRYWPFVRGIHRSPVNSPHTGQWHGALMFSLICARINGWVNIREAGDLRRHRAHYDVTVMDFLPTERISKYCLQNCGHFVQSSICSPQEKPWWMRMYLISFIANINIIVICFVLCQICSPCSDSEWLGATLINPQLHILRHRKYSQWLGFWDLLYYSETCL